MKVVEDFVTIYAVIVAKLLYYMCKPVIKRKKENQKLQKENQKQQKFPKVARKLVFCQYFFS